ncbi:MAG: 16S rRNA (cytosine(1402)-N(4))-methyltransferase RsmH [Myxococcales bacterium]|nr:16S rRNA (cytosine(1402)-N(4))-methyltransferase RsmH [Myxococcales bacterium]
MADVHTSVLLNETVEALLPRDGGIYLDATCGLGGHSERLLARCGPSGRVLSVDRDPEAIGHARQRLAPFGERSMIVQGHFSALAELAVQIDWVPADGVLVDLGVSSLQLDTADRGFSFMKNGPLDMRMGPEVGLSAIDLLQQLDVSSLAAILRELGEERFAVKVARAIITARDAGELRTTGDLAAVVERVLGGRRGATHPATRTFQALRMAVNRELDELRALLDRLPFLVRPGGRVAIISFHSLEDRLVKLSFLGPKPTDFPRGLPVEPPSIVGPWKVITKKPKVPSEVELAANPRSRSAKLRVAERRMTTDEGER